jgi:hypothetical protein
MQHITILILTLSILLSILIVAKVNLSIICVSIREYYRQKHHYFLEMLRFEKTPEYDKEP